jgi:hypothetical protein
VKKPETITIPLAYYEALEDIADSMSILWEEGFKEFGRVERQTFERAHDVCSKLRPDGGRFSDREDEA